MPIRKPDRVLLHHIPLKFVQSRVGGHGRKGVDSSIPLVPFIDFLITLVVFLIASFSASGDLLAQQASIKMPKAANTIELEPDPIVIAIDSKGVALDGHKVADTPTLARDPKVEPIDSLVKRLEAKERNWSILHPAGPKFSSTVVLQADEKIDFRVLKKVMASASAAGYVNMSFAVNKKGG